METPHYAELLQKSRLTWAHGFCNEPINSVLNRIWFKGWSTTDCKFPGAEIDPIFRMEG